MTEVKIGIDKEALYDAKLREAEAQIQELKAKVSELRLSLNYERELRKAEEKRVAELEEKLYGEQKTKRKRRTKAEMEEFRRKQIDEYSEYKSNGVRKKTKMQSMASYTDFKKLQDYFLERGQTRNYAIWTVGVSLGVRISDLAPLRWGNLLDENFRFRERVKMYEKKTSKLQNCLITPAVKEALTKLLDEAEWDISMDEAVFKSRKTGEPLEERVVWNIFSNAAKEAGIPYRVGTHTMRSTFSNIVFCVDKGTIDMNAITKVQALLNHSDPRTTMRYLGTLQTMLDKSRMTVSDFVQGKTGVDELVASEEFRLSDVMDKLVEIEERLDK